MDAEATLRELAARAHLPPVVSTRLLAERGFDNDLLLGILEDGRKVLLRRRSTPSAPPTSRTAFLAHHDVGAPAVYAADDQGAVLVEFIKGETLAAVAARGALGDREWQLVGRAYRRIHAVRFPWPLRGDIGPDRLTLAVADPVRLLLDDVDRAEPDVRRSEPRLLPMLDLLRERIDSRADELRRDDPCLAHTDANFHNIIVGTDEVRLIDWDYPGVMFPLEELSALEEHAFLNGVPELPPAFFVGYGREVSGSLLRLYRIVSALTNLGSTEWASMAADPRYPQPLRTMLHDWNRRLHAWILRLDDHLSDL